MHAEILANRRRVAPAGAAGGSDGACGVTRIVRADGRVQTLPATASMRLAAGDAVEIETPGGGGWGEEQA
jgi:5-oxoprolinase (ATP-hydrolysing)